MFAQLSDDFTYIKHETKIITEWKEKKIYDIIKKKNENKQNYRFMDGPPFPSSDTLHFGHLLIGYIKSTSLYYKQMNGYNCDNLLGYDCHGLPIESVANKQLGIYTKKEIELYGIDKYNFKCKEMIAKFSGAWQPIYESIGRMADFTHTYKTLDTPFMESVWWVFSQIYSKNLIYKGYQVMPYSNACNSPLSNFEAGQNYKDIETKSVYVMFKLKDFENTYIVAWTTTPWTLFSNMALCVNYSAVYDWIEYKEKVYICAKDLIHNLGFDKYKIIKSIEGEKLVGLSYEPLFDYVVGEFKIITDRKQNYVIVDNNSKVGTGIVHIAPYYGEDDYRVFNNSLDIEKTNMLDENGMFIDKIDIVKNLLSTDKDTNDIIIKALKIKGNLLKTQVYKHSYPFCYRTDTPLIYKLTLSYFLKVPELKDQLLKNNEKINWFPKNIGNGRFKNWLENAREWCISRNRFFGTPLPLWVSDDGLETLCISSIDELTELANLKIKPQDIHRENIDDIIIISKKTGKILRNTKLVLDCWFESGCVPIAQIHYPFENANYFDDKEFLSDFIAEGIDQTRGWFYTLLVISTALFNKPAFKEVICAGLVLDEKGVKFSKKYGNFTNPMEILNTYGADMTRIYLLSSPALMGDCLLFKESVIGQNIQKIIPYINGVKLFLVLCENNASKNHFLDTKLWQKTENIMDKWIISILHELIENITQQMEGYNIDKVIYLIFEFVDDLCNWYIKFNRDRLRSIITQEETNMSLSVLYIVLINFTKIIAPFLPFLSAHIYNYLKENSKNESVLLCDYPNKQDFILDLETIQKFDIFKVIIKNFRVLRKDLKVQTLKMPLYKATIYHNDSMFIEIAKTFEEFIKTEINCLDVYYDKLDHNLICKIVCFDSVLGKKFKGEAKKVKKLLENINENIIINLEEEFMIENYQISKTDYKIEKIPKILSSDNIICKIEGELMVSIDNSYTEELHNIYQTRQIITGIQKQRKEKGLKPWNKININLIGSDKFENIFKNYIDKLEEKLLNKVYINQKNDNKIFTQNKQNIVYFDDTKEDIEFIIYLV